MVELRKRGVLTAVICSESFQSLALHQARVFGWPDMPLIVIPHPLGGLSREEVKARAEIAVAQLVGVIGAQVP
jgi:hypothetical protein